jgi:hypothetical protein
VGPCLKVCALAHPSLAQLVERHLHAHLIVRNVSSDSDSYSPSVLLKLIHDNPTIQKHVRSLQINLFVSTRNTQELECILPKLTQLEAIFLYSTSIGWNDLRESFRTAFTNCLHLPTLTDVKIHAFPLSTLDHSRSLKRVLFPFCIFPCISCFRHSHLIPLFLGGNGHILGEVSQPEVAFPRFYRRPLARLPAFGCVRKHPDDPKGPCSDCVYAYYVLILPSYQIITRSISVRCDPTSNHPTDFSPLPFSLALLPHLERLTIQSSMSFTRQWVISCTSPDSLRLCCLPAIMHLLDTLPSPPTNPVHLMISVDIKLGNPFNDTSETDWSPLLSFPYFHVVPCVELRVRAHKTNSLNRFAQHDEARSTSDAIGKASFVPNDRGGGIPLLRPVEGAICIDILV